MAGRVRGGVAVALVAALVGLGALWRAAVTRAPGVPAAPAPGEASDRAQVPPPVAFAAPRATTQGAGPVMPASAPEAAQGAGPVAAPRASPRPLDAAWRNVRPAFGFRELGRLGPYVKTGLDAARTEMEFCFRQHAAKGDASPRATDPAILMLYLEAREGAIDVVETEVDYAGTQRRELVECCRDVLRGYEIPAFNVVPGQRYRMKYQLD